MKRKTTKPLEEKIGTNPHGLGVSKVFLNKTPKVLTIKEETRKSDLTKIENFQSSLKMSSS